ncbi:MAG: hypothetical protein JWM12_2365, partial [Ilumatobacteraceae bacterium]|nr:hypothetical protein [Ilumatobacteraceae bacterium]
ADADAAAIGEAVERYCALQWDASRTFVAPWSDVAPAAIGPDELVLHSAEQYARPGFPLAPWSPRTPTTWIRGTELPSGDDVSVPASLVFLVSAPPRPDDRVAMITSNGLAAGPTIESAALGGLCELIERDALLCCWMNRLPATELVTSTAGPLIDGIVRQYARQGVVVREFVLPTDLPATVVMAIAFDDDPTMPSQVVGLGCHPDAGVAAEKALFELCQARPSEARRFVDQPPAGRLRRYQDVVTLDDHSAFVSQRERRDELAFLWSEGRVVTLDDLAHCADDPAQVLADCSRHLSELGSRVAYVDLTLPDIAEVGLHVARAVATGLQPIHFGHGMERLGGRRLFELPRRLGMDARDRTVADLNPCPHPLA